MTSFKPEDLELLGAIAKARSSPLPSTENESDSAACNESPLQPPVQRIGAFSIPLQGWSLLRLDPPDAVVLHVAGEQLRVRVAGRWEPEEPERYLPNPLEPPQPHPGETHINYARRYREWSAPSRTNIAWMKWNARKTWVGQTVHQLRDLIEADASIPNDCFLVKK